MKLISCHIDNFGTLSNLDREFDPGENVILEDNGSGKSTFAAFLRVMFFGFEGDRKHDVLDNERKRFAPWQGGAYGGRVTFEVNGKTYEVTRKFGETEKKDVFELRDAKTNLPSEDFTEYLGEELFRMDRQSFSRTIFVGQMQIETETTDDINSHIGNVADVQNDMNHFNDAVKMLDDLANRMSATRKTGSISKRREQMSEIEAKLRSYDSVSESMEEAKRRMEEAEQKCAKLEAELSNDSGSQQEVRWEQLNTLFTEHPLSEEQIRAYSQESINLVQTKAGLGSAQLTEEENDKLSELSSLFASDTEEENPKTARNTWHEIELDRRSYDAAMGELKRSHQDLAGTRTQKRNLEDKIREYEQQLKGAAEYSEEHQNDTDKHPYLVKIILVAIVIAWVAKHFVDKYIEWLNANYRVKINIWDVIVPAIGIILIILIIAFVANPIRIEQSDDITPPETMRASFEERMEALNRDLDSKRADVAAKDEVVMRWKQKIDPPTERLQAYLAAHGKEMELKTAQSSDVNSAIDELESKYIEYTQLKSKQGAVPMQDLQTATSRMDEIRTVLKTYDLLIDDAKADDTEVNQKLLELSKMLAEYKSLSEQRRDRENALREQKELLTKLHSEYRENLTQKAEQLDEMDDMRGTLEQLSELQAEEKEKLAGIQNAKKYLEKAKAEVVSRYSAPILESFEKNMKRIDPENKAGYRIDTNMQVTVDAEGLQRDSGLFSAGYRDLIGFCLRLAFIDAVFTEEKPMLILDDPFTNLDDEKIKKARELVKEISKDYQVLYFTCSASRK